jgi:DNA-binding LacI/PurR family transcriptional regulator
MFKGAPGMTIKEIAKLAGVSASTVSRIINSPDDSFATQKVRDRVWAAIRETGFVPNPNARELKQRAERKETGGKSLICVLGRTKQINDDPFFAGIIRAIEHRALSADIMVSKIVSFEHSRLAPEDMGGKPVGAIIVGRAQPGLVEKLKDTFRNVVYVGRNPLDSELDQIICDGKEAAAKILSLLIRRGHSRIAYFGETVHEVRFEAYKEALLTEYEGLFPEYVVNAAHTADGGYSAAEALLQSGAALPSAVMCATDTVAIAAIRRFREARIKIPADLSVTGMDNIELAAYMTPMLSTVEMPAVEMGNLAVNILLDRAAGKHSLPLKILLPSKLINGESVGEPRR